MLRIMRASVVLPLPDSPMIVKISGLSAAMREADIVDRLRRARVRAARRVVKRLADVRELEQRARSWRAASECGWTAKQATRWPGASGGHRRRARAGRCPSPAGSADGSGSRAADRRGSAARPSSAFLRRRRRRCAAGWRSGARCRDGAAARRSRRCGPPRPAGRHT